MKKGITKKDEIFLIINLDNIQAEYEARDILLAWFDAPGNPNKSRDYASYASLGKKNVLDIHLNSLSGESVKPVITSNFINAGYEIHDIRNGYSLLKLHIAGLLLARKIKARTFFRHILRK